MTLPVVSECPFCKGRMEVTEVSCAQCDVQMRGHFTLSRYDRLNPEQAQFLEAFLRCRGVIRDMEVALGISYPTVRARLDGLLSALGFADGPSAPAPTQKTASVDTAARRREILKAIETGAMDAATGLDALKDLAD